MYVFKPGWSVSCRFAAAHSILTNHFKSKTIKKREGKAATLDLHCGKLIQTAKPLILQIKGENKQTWINTSVSAQVKSQVISMGLKSVTIDRVLVSSRVLRLSFKEEDFCLKNLLPVTQSGV